MIISAFFKKQLSHREVSDYRIPPGVYACDDGQMILSLAGTAGVAHRYLWGPAVDQLLADERVTNTNTPGEVLWALGDHLGSVRTLMNQHGVIRKETDYDAFGNVSSESNFDATGAIITASNAKGADFKRKWSR